MKTIFAGLNRTIVSAIIWTIIWALTTAPTPSLAAPSHFNVKVISASTPLSELPIKNLYAVGLGENGSSVIVIANGNISTGKVDSRGKVAVATSKKEKTNDLLFVNMSRWSEVPLPKGVKDRESLNKFIAETMTKFGYENPGTVPFLLKGQFKSANIVLPQGDKTKQFDLKKPGGLVVGFFTKTDSEDLKSVMHASFEKPQNIGRIDKVSFSNSSVILYLPPK